MMQDAILLVLGPVAALVVVALLLARLQDRRVKQLREAAEEMGFSFLPHDPLLAVELFGPAPGLSVVNVLRGKAQGLEVVLFDMHRIGRGTHAALLRISMMTILDDAANWPAFWMRPRQFLIRPGRDERKGIVLFEDDRTFGRSYLLEASDPESVSLLFTEEVRDYFAKHPGFWVQAGDRKLILSHGTLLSAAQFRSLLEEGFGVLNLLQSGEQRPE